MMNMTYVVETTTFLSAIGAGMVAGVFFTFSNFVMKALGRLPHEQGMRAMQSINITVLNPGFFTLFFGTALGALVLIVVGWLQWGTPGATGLMAGGGLYLVGCVLVTGVCNVPRNEALASLDPTSAEGASLWQTYLRRWTAWNHVRTGMSLASAIVMVLTLGGV